MFILVQRVQRRHRAGEERHTRLADYALRCIKCMRNETLASSPTNARKLHSPETTWHGLHERASKRIRPSYETFEDVPKHMFTHNLRTHILFCPAKVTLSRPRGRAFVMFKFSSLRLSTNFFRFVRPQRICPSRIMSLLKYQKAVWKRFMQKFLMNVC